MKNRQGMYNLTGNNEDSEELSLRQASLELTAPRDSDSLPKLLSPITSADSATPKKNIAIAKYQKFTGLKKELWEADLPSLLECSEDKLEEVFHKKLFLVRAVCEFRPELQVIHVLCFLFLFFVFCFCVFVFGFVFMFVSSFVLKSSVLFFFMYGFL